MGAQYQKDISYKSKTTKHESIFRSEEEEELTIGYQEKMRKLYRKLWKRKRHVRKKAYRLWGKKSAAQDRGTPV